MQIEETSSDLENQHFNIEKVELKTFLVKIMVSLLTVAYDVLIELDVSFLRNKNPQGKMLRATLSVVSCYQVACTIYLVESSKYNLALQSPFTLAKPRQILSLL